MSNYIQTRTQLRGERMVEALKKRNIEACYVATKEEALAQALRWIPEGSSVGWGGSMTINEIGLKDAIRPGQLRCAGPGCGPYAGGKGSDHARYSQRRLLPHQRQRHRRRRYDGQY